MIGHHARRSRFTRQSANCLVGLFVQFSPPFPLSKSSPDSACEIRFWPRDPACSRTRDNQFVMRSRNVQKMGVLIHHSLPEPFPG
jgi:hypothetical protein